jgi:hypothetical protein
MGRPSPASDVDEITWVFSGNWAAVVGVGICLVLLAWWTHEWLVSHLEEPDA